MPNVWLALLLAVAAASATFVGWAIAARKRPWPPKVFGAAMIAAGVAMILLSTLQLLPNALDTGLQVYELFLLLAAGAGIVIGLQYVARRIEFGGNALQRSALITAVALGLHNIPEGAAPFGSTLLSVQAGVVSAVAIALHNIPEGIAVSAPVLAGGGTRRRAFYFTAVATGGEILGAFIALGFVEVLTETRIGGLLAFVAGIMITLSLVELIPAGVKLVRDRTDNADTSTTSQPA